MSIKYTEVQRYKVVLRKGGFITAYSKRNRDQFCNAIRGIFESGVLLAFHQCPHVAARDDADIHHNTGIEFFGGINDILYVEHNGSVNVYG